jgi:hypothetical protein
MRLRLTDVLSRPNPYAPTDPGRVDAVAFDAEGAHLAIGARGRALVYRLSDGALVERYRTKYEETALPGEPDADAWSATLVSAVHLAPGGR